MAAPQGDIATNTQQSSTEVKMNNSGIRFLVSLGRGLLGPRSEGSCRSRGCVLGLGLAVLGITNVHAEVSWGFTPFPYDVSAEAVEKTYAQTSKLATVFAIHRDNGVPWQEALDDGEFPQEVRDQWNEHARNLPKGQKIYVGLAPLATDRESMAPASKGSRTSPSFLRKSLAADEVKRAYLNYVRRAVALFHPDYLNIGIEVGELAKHSSRRWSDFEVLFEFVSTAIKKEYPNVKIGISFGLYTLMEPAIAERSRRLVEQSDYIGISFYPFIGTPEQVKAPPGQWQAPLDWLGHYTKKPIAMVETGYSSTDVTLKSPEMHMHGTPALQQQYLTDLARVAKRDNYLMVNWFLLIDHDALSERVGLKKGDASRLWEHIGLIDKNLDPKPALATWQDILHGKIAAAAPSTPSTGAPAKTDPVPKAVKASPGKAYTIGFSSAADLFKGSGDDHMSLADEGPGADVKSMAWKYSYAKGRFQWGLRSIPQGAMPSATEMLLTAKSSQPSYLLVTVGESSGESYWTVFKTSSDWETHELPFAEFKRDEQKPKEDGKLQASKIVSIGIADGRALEGATGAQQVSIAQWIAH